MLPPHHWPAKQITGQVGKYGRGGGVQCEEVCLSQADPKGVALTLQPIALHLETLQSIDKRGQLSPTTNKQGEGEVVQLSMATLYSRCVIGRRTSVHACDTYRPLHAGSTQSSGGRLRISRLQLCTRLEVCCSVENLCTAKQKHVINHKLSPSHMTTARNR